MLMLPVQRARDLCEAVLHHLGFTPAEVAACTEAYLFASLRGLDSHGIVALRPAVAAAVKTRLVREAKAIPPAEGCAEVLLPGELEARQEARRARAGMPLAEADWDSMVSRLTASGVPRELCLSHAPE